MNRGAILLTVVFVVVCSAQLCGGTNRCIPFSRQYPGKPFGYLVRVDVDTSLVSSDIVLSNLYGPKNSPCLSIQTKPIRVKKACDFTSEVVIPMPDIQQKEVGTHSLSKDHFVCSKNASNHQWVHMGLEAKPIFSELEIGARKHLRSKRSAPADVEIIGLRVEGGGGRNPYNNDDGIATIMANTDAVLRIFGKNLGSGLKFKFAYGLPSEFNDTMCDDSGSTRVFTTDAGINSNAAFLPVKLPDMSSSDGRFYLCLKQEIAGVGIAWNVLGSDPALLIRTDSRLLPVWLQLLIIAILLILSGLFSGLNLGLMALDRTDLKIICNTGSEKEKRYAQKVMPVRQLGNYLLCSLLLGNVLVNSSLTLLLDDLTSGLVAVVGSTMGIVIFGEIIPQAICSRHGLAIGAWTVWITKIFMAATFPLSYPISKILDKFLGEEIGNYYNRERLKELVKVTNEYNDLERDEVNIISGALDLKKKTVSEVMTKLDDVFMLSYEAVLDFTTMSEIRRNGYSRIPVYERDRSNIVGVLYVKDLVLMDPDDDTPLKTLCDFYQNPCFFTFHDTTLDVIFRQFKGGDRGHMAFIQQVIDTGEKDPFYEVIGIVTLEDVIEEIIQAEIVDETDVFTDNRTKKRLRRNEARENESLFVNKRLDTKLRISPQLAMAALQYLSTSVEAFKPFRISEQILRKLLQQDIFFLIKAPKVWEGNGESSYMIYQRGKPEDYFVLILEGRAEVIVGSENLTFEAGPFTCFGMRALGFLDKDDPGPADQPRFSIFSTGAIQNSRSGSQQLNSVHFSQSQEKMSPGTEKKLLSKKPSTLARNTSHKNPSRDPPGDDTFEETALLVPPSCHSRPTLKKNKQKINNNNNILAVCSGACPHWNSCPSFIGKPPPPDNPYGDEEPMPAIIEPEMPDPGSTFVPDYSVRAVTDLSFIKIRSSQYVAARRATALFHSTKQECSSRDDNQLDSEVDKIWKDAENSTNLQRSRQPSVSSALSTPSTQRRTSMDSTIDTQPPSPSMPGRDATTTSVGDCAEEPGTGTGTVVSNPMTTSVSVGNGGVPESAVVDRAGGEGDCPC